ncbi:MAG TPA: acyl carrier protein [Anaerolineales bacterium]|nr:acyl carrier protein [Anaerolineales bacterium]
MNIESSVEKFILEDLLSGSRSTKIGPDESLVASGILDSLALLRMISFLEEKFGVTVNDDEVVPENFETINVIKSFVEARLK